MKQYQRTIHAIWTIAKKEIIDNLRDKRALFFSILYGPVFLPLLIIGPLVAGVNKHTIDFEQAKIVHTIGAERTPNLVAFLKSKNLDVVDAPESYLDAIEEERVAVVLEVSPDYEQQLRAGQPAMLTLHFNSDLDNSRKLQQQLQSAIEEYSRTLSIMRLRIRGIDQNLLNAVQISQNNLAREQNEGRTLSSTYLFIVLMSMMLGGFYLAVDSGAGERERHSLEPLMSLPLSRMQIVLGKYLSLLAFVGFAGLLPLLTSFIGLQFLPEGAMVGLIDTSFHLVWKSILVVLPLILFIPSFLFLIGSFSSTTKEAQTHLGFATLVPMLPFFAMQFWSLEVSGPLLWVPILGQFHLMELAVSGEALALGSYMASAAGTLTMASFCLLLTAWLYRRDNFT